LMMRKATSGFEIAHPTHSAVCEKAIQRLVTSKMLNAIPHVHPQNAQKET